MSNRYSTSTHVSWSICGVTSWQQHKFFLVNLSNHVLVYWRSGHCQTPTGKNQVMLNLVICQVMWCTVILFRSNLQGTVQKNERKMLAKCGGVPSCWQTVQSLYAWNVYLLWKTNFLFLWAPIQLHYWHVRWNGYLRSKVVWSPNRRCTRLVDLYSANDSTKKIFCCGVHMPTDER